MEFLIEGNPIAKKRPRFARRGKFVVTYSDQETEEGRYLWEVKKQWNSGNPLFGPIALSMGFYVSIPKSTSQKKQRLMLDGKIIPTKKPDLDNLIKFPLDILNGLIWKDDSQVFLISAFKKYSDHPRTYIEVKEIKNEAPIL
jgi:Holliday junction resolvase RusA-like endonuclease